MKYLKWTIRIIILIIASPFLLIAGAICFLVGVSLVIAGFIGVIIEFAFTGEVEI